MDIGHHKVDDSEIENQKKTPFLEAVKEYLATNPTSFDVPGHKFGHFRTDLEDYLGDSVYKFDVNAPLGLDNLSRPRGVIKESEDLFAKAIGADYCLYQINGTTGAIHTMILGCLRPKDKIILPRNVHKSIVNSLILSGAVPIFVYPDIDPHTGIANGVSLKEYERAIKDNPDAKAVLVINPTYFGVTSNIEAIAELAHKNNMIAMADEAHGTHFYFSSKLPKGALEAGFDISASSMHKTGGSLTQSSVIIIKGKRVDVDRVKTVAGMMSSTSPNSTLMASIEAARKRMFFQGEELISKVIDLVNYARTEVNNIPGLKAIDRTYINGDSRFGLDETKLVVDVSGLGVTGFDVYREMRYKYNVQLELGEYCDCLAVFAVGTSKEDVDKLIEAYKGISREHYGKKDKKQMPTFSFRFPELVTRPRVAFSAPSKVVSCAEAIGEISAESVMIYPPGIPVVIPGEIITKEIVDMLTFYKENNGVILNDAPDGMMKIIDRKHWFLKSDLDYDF